MLFVVTHTHTAEMCPGGPFNPNPEWMANINAKTKEAGVKIIAAYSAAQGHLFWWVVDADTAEALTTFCWPLEEVGDAVATAAQTMEEAHHWTKQHNIMR